MPGPATANVESVSGKTPQLLRALGVSHATAIVVGTIIGSGIFLVPSEMMQAVGSAKLVYLAWFVGGLLSFFGALTYAELGAMKPEAGGEYVMSATPTGRSEDFYMRGRLCSSRSQHRSPPSPRDLCAS